MDDPVNELTALDLIVAAGRGRDHLTIAAALEFEGACVPPEAWSIV